MDPWLISTLILFALIILAGRAIFISLRRGGLPMPLLKIFVPVHKKKYLLTPNEEKVYAILKNGLGAYFDIWGQVAVTSLIDGGVKAYFWGVMGKLKYKSVDFLAVGKTKEGKHYPRVAIELDDRSHFLDRRQARDRYIEAAFENGHIKLFRIKQRDYYDEQELIEKLWAYIKREGYYMAESY